MSQLVCFQPEEVPRLQLQIEQTRAELAGLEAEYALLQRSLRGQRAAIFERLAPKSQIRDELRLEVRYLAQVLDDLRKQDESSAKEAAATFEAAREQTRAEYQKATREAAAEKPPSEEESEEMNSLWRKLVKLYHPDRLGMENALRESYHRLISAINHARDAGDMATLREIAADPQAFLQRKGWGSLKTEDERRLEDLQELLESLQSELAKVRTLVTALQRTPDYELHQLLKAKPAVFEQVVEKQLGQLDAEITVLQAQVRSLNTEIKKVQNA